MGSTSTLVNLPQLTSSTNFNNWKFRLKMILEERQIAEALEKTEEDYTETAAINEFKIKDAKARSVIVQCLTDKYLDLVKDSKSAKEMMESLEGVFQRKSVFTKLTLKRRLISFKLKKGEKLEDHFLKFDTLVRDLENVGSKIEEEDRICYLLLSVDEVYGAVVTALETMNTELKMDFVKSRLLDEETKIKDKDSKNENVAFLSCYKCGKPGHRFYECRQNNRGRGFPRGRGRGNNRGSSNRGGYRGGSNSQNNSQQNVGQQTAQGAHKANEIAFIASSNITKTSSNIQEFILDSGCTQHMVMSELEPYMTDIKEIETARIGTAKNDQILYASKQGTLRGTCQGEDIKIEALLVQGISHNLISISKLLKKDFKIIFDSDKQGRKKAILSKNDSTFYCNTYNDLFILGINFQNVNDNYTEKNDCLVGISSNTDKNLWHRRLGHVNRYSLSRLGLPFSTDICGTCIEGKGTRKPFYSKEKRSARIGELIHTDIAGPVAQATPEGHRYFQVLIDDFSHFLVVKLLKNKNEAEQNVIDFIKLIKTQHGLKTKRIRLDNGGEFVTNNFKDFCRNKGINLEYTMPYTPQENGTSERMNRTLLDKVRTKFVETNLPRELWGEAIQCSAYELNRLPTDANNGQTPAERWYGRNDLSKLRVFGSKAWAIILPRQSKLERRSQPCIHIGYSKAGYRLWNYERQEIFCSRDVKFNEKQTNYNEIKKENAENDESQQRIIQTSIETPEYNLRERRNEMGIEIGQENETEDNQEEEINEDSDIGTDEYEEHLNRPSTTIRGRRITQPKYLDEYETYTAYCLISANREDPIRYEDAIKSKEWKEAIKKELDSHEKLKTWSEMVLPEGKTAIETKWVFRTKEDGTKKARLVAKGFQIKEEDPFEPNYSPVARMSTVRLLMSIALQKDWSIRQLDIPTAFLNGRLESEIYIYSPLGLKSKTPVLKLNRALYGLKESPKVWNETFNKFATKNNFERSRHDCCLYQNGKVWMLIYVDDMLLVGDQKDIKEIIKPLKEYFQAKDLGKIKNFLGMNIIRTKDKLKIDQGNFIEKLLINFKMENCNPKKTPMEKGFQANKDSKKLENVPYRQLVGGLMYLATTSRPDIGYGVSYLSRFLDQPTEELWNAGKRILRYLQGTKDKFLTYHKNVDQNVKLNGYSDADWGTDIKGRKSVSGCIILYGNNPIYWFSKKQTCVALSSAEAEYVAASTSAQNLINLKGILNDFNLANEATLFCDNKSSILMSKSYENSKRSKHIDIRHHYLKDLVLGKEIFIEYVSTDQNLADILTKSLGRETFVYLRDKIYIL